MKSGGGGCQAKGTARTKAPRKDHQEVRVAEDTEEGWGGRGVRMRGHIRRASSATGRSEVFIQSVVGRI